jgi:hypothetical protein
MAPEYAKELVWGQSFHTLENQTYVFGKQLHRLFRLKDKVQAIITDSPLLLSLVYDQRKLPSFTQFVLDEFCSFRNLNIFLQRQKTYNPNGRMQTEDEARTLDTRIRNVLESNGISFVPMVGCRESVRSIADMIEEEIHK